MSRRNKQAADVGGTDEHEGTAKHEQANPGDHEQAQPDQTGEEGAVLEQKGIEAAAAEKKKSIVPSKYAEKYKSGEKDDLGKFIEAQVIIPTAEGGTGAFDFDRFFKLCKANGIADHHVDPYIASVGNKEHGSQGRTRMTLRNRLAPIARKTGELVGLDGQKHKVHVPPAPVRGAAAASALKAEDKEPAAA